MDAVERRSAGAILDFWLGGPFIRRLRMAQNDGQNPVSPSVWRSVFY